MYVICFHILWLVDAVSVFSEGPNPVHRWPAPRASSWWWIPLFQVSRDSLRTREGFYRAVRGQNASVGCTPRPVTCLAKYLGELASDSQNYFHPLCAREESDHKANLHPLRTLSPSSPKPLRRQTDYDGIASVFNILQATVRGKTRKANTQRQAIRKQVGQQCSCSCSKVHSPSESKSSIASPYNIQCSSVARPHLVFKRTRPQEQQTPPQRRSQPGRRDQRRRSGPAWYQCQSG